MRVNTKIIEALHNYNYRCVNQKDDIIVFAKPMGYSIVKVEITPTNIEMILIVKNTDGENLVWTSKTETLEDIKDSEEYYLNVVQIIMDFEASILGKHFAWEINRNKRFDFRENVKCLNELYW